MGTRAERLLIIAATPPIDRPTLGGNHRYLLNMMRPLKSLDLELNVISDEHPAYSQLLDTLDAHGVRRHRAPLCSDPQEAAAMLDAAIDDLGPVLIHVNGHQGWLRPVILRSRTFVRAGRRLFTMHGPLQSIDILETRSFKRFIPGTWSANTTRLDRKFLRLFHRTVSVSKRFGEALVNGRLLKPDRLVCIPNAVDINRFCPVASPPTGQFIVGAAGNLTQVKRFDVLITAFAELQRSHPEARLRIAGEGEDRRKLQDLAERMGIGRKVSLVGFQHDMAGFYNSLDVFVLSSESEGAPYVVLEAAASGKPLVLTDVGDIRNVFHNGVDALIVPPNDSAALLNRILALASDPGMRRSLSSAARRLIVEQYSEDAWSQSMTDFFTKETAAARS